MVVQLVGQPQRAALQLDVLVRLVIAGPPAGVVRHSLVTAEPVAEEP